MQPTNTPSPLSPQNEETKKTHTQRNTNNRCDVTDNNVNNGEQMRWEEDKTECVDAFVFVLCSFCSADVCLFVWRPSSFADFFFAVVAVVVGVFCFSRFHFLSNFYFLILTFLFWSISVCFLNFISTFQFLSPYRLSSKKKKAPMHFHSLTLFRLFPPPPSLSRLSFSLSLYHTNAEKGSGGG